MSSGAGSVTRRPCSHRRLGYQSHITDVVHRCPLCNGILGYSLHPAYAKKNDGKCYFLKLPAEVRLKIFRFVWDGSDTKNGTQRRIHWEGAVPFRPQYESLTSARPRQFLNTAILSTCKFIYGEAHPELISNSTLIVEIGDMKALQRYPRILKIMRYLEVRDSENLRGRQLFLTRQNEGRWLPEEKEAEFRELTYVLRGIKPVVDQAPQLKSVIIGFEVLRVLADCRAGIIGGQDLTELKLQVHNHFAPTGLGTLTCKDVGKWRAVRNGGPDIEVRHFNVVNNFEQCVLRTCLCFGDYPHLQPTVSRAMLLKLSCFALARRGLMTEAKLSYLRHVMAQYGLLGEQAQRVCRATGAQIQEANQPTGNTAKTWWMIANDPTDKTFT